MAVPIAAVFVPPRKGVVVAPKSSAAGPTRFKIFVPEMLLNPSDYDQPDRCVPEMVVPHRFATSKSRPLPPPLSVVPSKQWGDGSYVLTVRSVDPLSVQTWERLQQNKRKSWMMDADDSNSSGLFEDRAIEEEKKGAEAMVEEKEDLTTPSDFCSG